MQAEDSGWKRFCYIKANQNRYMQEKILIHAYWNTGIRLQPETAQKAELDGKGALR